MGAFIDSHGVWTRNVPWVTNGKGRTDIPSSILNATNFREALFRFQDGSHVSISADDLRKALRSAPTRRDETIVGPFNIDLESGTVFGIDVDLQTDAETLADPDFVLLQQLEKDLIDDGVFNVASIEDARSSSLRAVIQRRGQSSFRSKLLEAYDYRCAMTDCDVEQILEAAHIIPYKGPATNHIQNGLLLRADIHVLFDLYLISIEPHELEIVISKRIRDSKYAALVTGRRLRIPTDSVAAPSLDALAFHFSGMTERERSF